MIRKFLPVMVALAAVSATWSQCHAGGRHRTSPDVFHNYYVPPAGCGTTGAQLYLCPRPVPPVVGHTYITYQPLMPHEFLYPHHRTYVRRHPGGGCTTTSVMWTHDLDLFGWLRRPPKVFNAPRWHHKGAH